MTSSNLLKTKVEEDEVATTDPIESKEEEEGKVLSVQQLEAYLVKLRLQRTMLFNEIKNKEKALFRARVKIQ